MSDNKYNFDSTRSTAEQDFSRGREFDSKNRSFRLRIEADTKTIVTRVIAGAIVIGLIAYGAYRIGSSSEKLADKINDRLAPYLIDEK